MPFKIYTYEDPYKLDKADFWSEISALPHFCSARTLVNGLKDVLGDSIKGLICPLDELVQHEEVYMQWTDNISLRVQQYSAFSSAFKQLLEKRRISKPFHMALEQNQNHFLEAIRLFIELDISASAIDGSKGNTEQKLFVHMLKKAQESSLFRFPQTPSREKLKEIVVSLAKKEVEECTGTPQEVKRCERAVAATKELPFDSIVVHGVHQFTPVQLRLLLAMEKMGITIIFLFNYQKKYSKIYSSWNDIYGCFEVPIHHDTVVREYTPPTMQNPSNALACALGEICEDRNAVGSGILRKWYKLYKSVQLMEFANITEYAHFVSNHFDAAIQRYSESRSVMERGNDVWSNAAVLRHLDEQVYTANRDVHTLLKIYYPEYAKDRHFLSYPIGQFFSAIYRLWDYENGKIIFDVMNCPNLLDGVNDGELVVVPKDVNNELEHHKTRFGADDRKFKAQKAITAIFNYKRRFPLTYADGLPSLVPEAYRAKADEKEQNDNKILAVALRYKIYTDIPVLFITDDRSLSNKASGEGLDVWTSKDFLAPPETSFDDESPTVPGTPAPIPELEAQIAEATAAETPALESSEEERLDAEAAETKRQAKAKEEYLAQKISTKLLHLEASQISLLQNNGIKTIADFMAQTENSFASMKVKKGIPFTARFLKEQETIRCKLENL